MLMLQRLTGFGALRGGSSGAQGFDPLNKGTAISLSNNNRTINRASGTNWKLARGVTPHSTGKWYAEFTIDSVDNSSYDVSCGVMKGTAQIDGGTGVQNYLGEANSAGYVRSGIFYLNGANSGTADVGYSGSDVIALTMDFSNNTVTFYANNVVQGGLGITGPVYLGASLFDPGAQVTLNTGQVPFIYTPPTGFSAWG